MFGYIAADTGKLNKEQRARYRSLYCGLCHALGRRYGLRSRLLLSFDTAFLLMLLEREKTEGCKSLRCPFKPFEKRDCVCGQNADYCADITVLLSCLKLEDDIADDNSLKAKLLLKLFKNEYRLARNRRPELTEKIKSHLTALSQMEKANETNPDLPANEFGALLADVFSVDGELTALGKSLGRFIYLADAACDFKSDIRHGRYNPLIRKKHSDFYKMLARELGQVLEQLDKLQSDRYRDIIENVLYHGVWIKINLKGIYDTGSV